MDKKRKMHLEQLLQQLGIASIPLELVNLALTHPSFAYENPELNEGHNQRLEFLGDAVLNIVVGEYFYRNFPEYSEGELTRCRAQVVCASTLAARAQQLGLGQYLRLGKGEEMNGGRNRASVLADAFEALVGAMYLPLSWPEVQKGVLALLQPYLEVEYPADRGDYKTALQEVIQKKGESVVYAILQESGPDHNKRFVAGVFCRGFLLGKGEGRSKKEAEQKAAGAALSNPELEVIVSGASKPERWSGEPGKGASF